MWPTLSILFGSVLLGIAVVLVRRIGQLDRRLPADEQHHDAHISRWPSQPRQWYRPRAWPALASLRRLTLAVYVCGGLGLILLGYGCPHLGR